MIIKRKPPKAEAARRIVKRGRPAAAEMIGKTIVRRARGATVGSAPPRQRVPRFRRPALGWRPSKGLVWGVGSLATLGLLGYATFWVWTSPFFKVSSIEVVGNERVATGTVVESTGLLGSSMFDADVAGAQQALYDQPLVNAVRIERDWPNTIRVVIEERQAWGTWEQSGVRYVIDREGVVLAIGSAAQGAPAIKSSDPGNRIVGDRVDYQAVDAAAEIYDKLPRQLGATVAEVSFSTGKGVQVTTSNNQTALFGDSSSIAYKLAVWAALQSEAQVQRINYTTIDLRYGNRPVLQ